jgi:hypothetical protein
LVKETYETSVRMAIVQLDISTWDMSKEKQNIVPYSPKPEYLNQSERPLLDNGYDKTKYAALSR